MIVFVGFNLTFFPQFILGYLGMPRRYHAYPPEFQVLNVLSTAGASILAVGYLLPLIYLTWSLRSRAPRAGPNPWGATGLEWETPSPPPTANFEQTPIVTAAGLRLHERGRACLRSTPPWPRTATRTIRGSSTTSTRMEQQLDASTLGMWVFLVTEVLFFGGLFMAYILYRIWYPEVSPPPATT